MQPSPTYANNLEGKKPRTHLSTIAERVMQTNAKSVGRRSKVERSKAKRFLLKGKKRSGQGMGYSLQGRRSSLVGKERSLVGKELSLVGK